jgi:hypothetical protein
MRRKRKMNKKIGGIIATIVAVFLCGCPGLVLCVFGIITATGNMPLTLDFPYTSDFGNPYSEIAPSYFGYALLGLALIFIAIPIVVGFLTLRSKPEKPTSSHEPFSPAS